MSHPATAGAAHHAPAEHGAHGHEEDPIKKFYEHYQKVKDWIDTHEMFHSSTYTETAKKVLKKKKGRGYDWAKLRTKEGQDEFVNALVESYLEKAKEIHGIEIPKDENGELSRDDLLYLMSGQTRDAISQAVKQLKDNYRLANHRRVTEKHIKELSSRHLTAAYSHLNDEKHKSKMLKFMNLDDLVGTADEPDFSETYRKFEEYASSDIGQARLRKTYAGDAHGAHSGGAHHP